jgi:hypothetical protein
VNLLLTPSLSSLILTLLVLFGGTQIMLFLIRSSFDERRRKGLLGQEDLEKGWREYRIIRILNAVTLVLSIIAGRLAYYLFFTRRLIVKMGSYILRFITPALAQIPTSASPIQAPPISESC